MSMTAGSSSGFALHRRRTVIVRQSETGEHLETRRIVNDPLALAREIGKAGPEPDVVLEATYRKTAEPVHGRIRHRSILGGLINQYEPAA